jgi:hypothetical protein
MSAIHDQGFTCLFVISGEMDCKLLEIVGSTMRSCNNKGDEGKDSELGKQQASSSVGRRSGKRSERPRDEYSTESRITDMSVVLG